MGSWRGASRANFFVALLSGARGGSGCGRWEKQKQIPFGNDNKNGKCKGKSKCNGKSKGRSKGKGKWMRRGDAGGRWDGIPVGWRDGPFGRGRAVWGWAVRAGDIGRISGR